MADTRVDVQGMYHNLSLSILYVGEGDFSFSSSFATLFSVASNIVATSLDSTGDLIKKYGVDAIQNTTNLRNRGAQVIHSVDVHNMAEKDGSLLPFVSGISPFDVVNYNFPHAGFFGKEDDPEIIRKHTKLLQGFFANAAKLLAPGGVVYVAHKCGPPYDSWNLNENANKHGLEFIGHVRFDKSVFRGYNNRRGSGKRARETFALGEAAIYVFALRCKAWIENMEDHLIQQTPDIEQNLLQTLANLRSFAEGGRAFSLLEAIEAEVARLQNKKLGAKKERKLYSMKLVLKYVPLLVNNLAILQIQGFHPAKSYKKLEQSWEKLQKMALKADLSVNELDVRHAQGDSGRGRIRVPNCGTAAKVSSNLCRRPVEAEKAKVAASVQLLPAESRDTTIVHVLDPRPQGEPYANAYQMWWQDVSLSVMRGQLSSLLHWVHHQYDVARRWRYGGTDGAPSPPVGGEFMPYGSRVSNRQQDSHPGPHAPRAALHSGAPQARRDRTVPEKHDILICNCCRSFIARKSDVLVMGAIGAISAYVHVTLTSLSSASNLLVEGAPTTKNSWLPGYAWDLVKCKGCFQNRREQHMGWRFIAVDPETRPQTFWGIGRTQLMTASSAG